MIFLFRKHIYRSIARNVVLFLCLVGMLIQPIGNVYAEEVLKPERLYSGYAALMDGYTGRLLWGKDETVARANASTTKIMTCILALELGNLEDMVTVSARAARQPKVHLGMQEGETFRLKDLLYCLMLESFNDCAVAIAEHIAGSVEDFAELLNQKAAEIGCTDTYFITPNGLDDENEGGFHHTTAQDLCRMMRYCVWESPQKDTFLTITQTASYEFQEVDGTNHQIQNHNRLIRSMDGAISGKTGFTADAGYCYVMAYEKDGKRFTAAFLACGWPNNKEYKWQDAAKMMEYADLGYESRNFFVSPEFERILVENGCPAEAVLSDWQGSVALNPYLKIQKDGEETVLTGMIAETEQLSYRFHYSKTLQHALMEDTVIGTYEIYLDEELIASYEICAGTQVQRWSLRKLWELIFASFRLS